MCEQAGDLLEQQDSRGYAEQGNTPLHLACSLNDVEAVKLLLALGADTECLNLVTRTKQGKQPLDLLSPSLSSEIRAVIQESRRAESKTLDMSATALLGRTMSSPFKSRGKKVQPHPKEAKYKV